MGEPRHVQVRHPRQRDRRRDREQHRPPRQGNGRGWHQPRGVFPRRLPVQLVYEVFEDLVGPAVSGWPSSRDVTVTSRCPNRGFCRSIRAARSTQSLSRRNGRATGRTSSATDATTPPPSIASRTQDGSWANRSARQQTSAHPRKTAVATPTLRNSESAPAAQGELLHVRADRGRQSGNVTHRTSPPGRSHIRLLISSYLGEPEAFLQPPLRTQAPEDEEEQVRAVPQRQLAEGRTVVGGGREAFGIWLGLVDPQGLAAGRVGEVVQAVVVGRDVLQLRLVGGRDVQRELQALLAALGGGAGQADLVLSFR